MAPKPGHPQSMVKDAIIAIGLALVVVGTYELLGILGAVLAGGP
jgi:hypothetical protein